MESMGMASRWLNKTLVFILTLNIFAVIISADSLDLNVVYPRDNQTLPPVDSCFIFGSVSPKASLLINGIEVEINKNGGWLAFLPVKPGEFSFNIRAKKNGMVEEKTVLINMPDLPRYTFDSMYIQPGSMTPSRETWVKAGDVIVLTFNSLPFCNAFCVVEPFCDTVSMTEAPASNYYTGKSVFGSDDNINGLVPESLLVRGKYIGRYTVPAFAADSLIFIYHLYPPSEEQLEWINKYRLDLKRQELPTDRIRNLTEIICDTAIESAKIIHDDLEPTIELANSISIIRTGPGKGYLCIHQPAGIRAKLIGKDGRWLKIRLSDYLHGWIIDTAAVLLPTTENVPHSYIRNIQTKNQDEKVSVIVSTSGKHPFKIEENIKEKSITVSLYGADSDTDWIRYDNADSLIDHIIWFQPEPGVYAVKIYLTANRIWGYDGYYIGNEFCLDIKKFPRDKIRLSQFRFVIDPGHSENKGAVGPTGLTEKDANLYLALQLKKQLEREGAEVILTRDDDSHLPLYDRPKIAKRENTDIFISIHNNALPPGTNPFINNGTSTFYYHPHSAPLAHAVHQSLARNLDLNDFGWYYGNFAVIRPTQYPAILVECAFMMIPEQEAALRTEKFQKKIVRAIIEGVKDFLRGRAQTEWDIQQEKSYGR
ncbi:MAG: N-acetylmuramoyl-L-alanine amidase [Candidatus Zixiibacteriota bacterium]